jgi:DNA-binding transcriptional ArsR family regulator
MKVVLDKRSLFALASDTRLEMLKALEPNRRTVSQLAEVVKIDKAAVHRHLKKLEEGGFVSRTEDHGFVYYALTWKSRDILNPNDKTKIVILISSSLICMLALIVVVSLASSNGALGTTNSPAESKYDQLVDQPGGSDGTPIPTTSPSGGVDIALPSAVLGLVAAAFLCSAYLVWRTPRQRGGEEREGTFESSPLDADDD